MLHIYGAQKINAASPCEVWMAHMVAAYQTLILALDHSVLYEPVVFDSV